MTECLHEWDEVEVQCETCGTHPAVWCELCETLVDLAAREDPRAQLPPDVDGAFVARVAAAINALDIDVCVREGVGSVRADIRRYWQSLQRAERRKHDEQRRIRAFDEWHASPPGTPWPFPLPEEYP